MSDEQPHNNMGVSLESKWNILHAWFRSSHQMCSLKKGVFINIAKFMGKHVSQCLFLNKVAVLRPATLFKKETLAQVFSCEFAIFLRTTFFKKHLRTTVSASWDDKIFASILNLKSKNLKVVNNCNQPSTSNITSLGEEVYGTLGTLWQSYLVHFFITVLHYLRSALTFHKKIFIFASVTALQKW